MDVVELLSKFVLRVDVHVEIATLPETARQFALFGESKGELCCLSDLLGAQLSGHALFEDLHGFCGRRAARLAD